MVSKQGREIAEAGKRRTDVLESFVICLSSRRRSRQSLSEPLLLERVPEKGLVKFLGEEDLLETVGD